MDRLKELVLKAWKWIRIDGLLHIETVYMITMLVYAFFRLMGSRDFAFFIAFAVGMIGAVGKEVWDCFHEGHSAEDHDLYCDFIGSGLALMTMLIVHV